MKKLLKPFALAYVFFVVVGLHIVDVWRDWFIRQEDSIDELYEWLEN